MLDSSLLTPNIPWRHLQNGITAELDLADNSGGEKDAALTQAASTLQYFFFFFDEKTNVGRSISTTPSRPGQGGSASKNTFYPAMEGLANEDLVDSNLAFICPMYFLGLEVDSRVRAVVGVLQIFELDQKCWHSDVGDMIWKGDLAERFTGSQRLL